jgi:hypothetical protein
MNTPMLFGGVFVVITLVTSSVLIVGLNGNAYSQIYPPGYQLPQSKQVGGKYVNPGFGLEITFPQGFNGYESSSMGYTSVELMAGTLGVANYATISLVLTDYGASMQSVPGYNVTNGLNVNPSSNGQNDVACEPAAGCIKIGDKNAQVYSTESNMGGYFSKSKSYSVAVGPYKTFQITYSATSQQDYDSNLAKFEESLKTIKFTK